MDTRDQNLPGFLVELLRAFNEKYTIPNAVMVDVHAGICECDLSFLTAVTQVEILEMDGCSLTLPTTVVRFNGAHPHKGRPGLGHREPDEPHCRK